MRKLIVIFFVLTVAFAASAARAVQPDEIMSDPVKESRARDLSRELRCMVCQNQSIDDSEAPLARDLRLLVRERIAAGDSDAQVIDFLVARYGEFVLLKPRLERHTLLLWLLPPLALAGGVEDKEADGDAGGDPADYADDDGQGFGLQAVDGGDAGRDAEADEAEIDEDFHDVRLSLLSPLPRGDRG